MVNFDNVLDTLTNDTGEEISTDQLPIGYVIRKEPKANRRSFALQKSVLDALQIIAKEKGTNLNALVNDVLLDYVNEYNGRG